MSSFTNVISRFLFTFIGKSISRRKRFSKRPISTFIAFDKKIDFPLKVLMYAYYYSLQLFQKFQGKMSPGHTRKERGSWLATLLICIPCHIQLVVDTKLVSCNSMANKLFTVLSSVVKPPRRQHQIFLDYWK